MSSSVARHRSRSPYSGVAIAVALVALIGVFSVISASTMTDRAVSQVVVDWQVQPRPGADADAVGTALKALPNVRAVERVGYTDVARLQATTAETVQTTGAASVLGLDPAYTAAFPEQMRLLLGTLDGPILAQQTAANLHAGIGDTVEIHPAGSAPVSVRVAGIVELPNADALFQTVGAPAGTGPTAPPDNVVILPMADWSSLFGADAAGFTQFHVAFTARRTARPSGCCPSSKRRGQPITSRRRRPARPSSATTSARVSMPCGATQSMRASSSCSSACLRPCSRCF